MKHAQYLFATMALLVAACNNAPSNRDDDTDRETPLEISYEPGTRQFDIDFDPSQISSYEDYRNGIDHYWDNFDFESGQHITDYDTTYMLQAMANYIAYMRIDRDIERRDSLLRALMHRAEHSRPMLDFFAMATEAILHDPNSPLRDDELYIPILEVLVESPLLDEYDRIAPAYDLEIALKNRIGHIATDFEFRLANGRTMSLHSIDTEYTILLFSNPGCPMCREIMDEITSSPLLNELTERGMLRTLSIYPDADLEAWHNYQPEMPRQWISGYDHGMRLTNERLYNLQAIPSLYLLNREKRVMIKDGVSVADIENVIAITEAER